MSALHIYIEMRIKCFVFATVGRRLMPAGTSSSLLITWSGLRLPQISLQQLLVLHP